MLRGERAAFKIAPELSFGQKDCRLQPPKGVSAEADLVIDLQLVNWYRKAEVRTVGDEGLIVRTLRSSDSWEHPRPPFEVHLAVRFEKGIDHGYLPLLNLPEGVGQKNSKP